MKTFSKYNIAAAPFDSKKSDSAFKSDNLQSQLSMRLIEVLEEEKHIE